MNKKFNIYTNENGDNVIKKEEGSMNMEELYNIFDRLIKQGKSNYCVKFEAWSSLVGEISIDDKSKQICLD